VKAENENKYMDLSFCRKRVGPKCIRKSPISRDPTSVL